MGNMLRKPVLAKKLGCSQKSLDRYEADGRIPPRYNFPGYVAWDEDEVEEFKKRWPRGLGKGSAA